MIPLSQTEYAAKATEVSKLPLLAVSKKKIFAFEIGEIKYPIFLSRNIIGIQFVANFSFNKEINKMAILADLKKNISIVKVEEGTSSPSSNKIDNITIFTLTHSEGEITTKIKLDINRNGRSTSSRGFFRVTYQDNTLIEYLRLRDKEIQVAYISNPKKFSETQQKMEWFTEFQKSYSTAKSTDFPISNKKATEAESLKIPSHRPICIPIPLRPDPVLYSSPFSSPPPTLTPISLRPDPLSPSPFTSPISSTTSSRQHSPAPADTTTSTYTNLDDKIANLDDQIANLDDQSAALLLNRLTNLGKRLQQTRSNLFQAMHEHQQILTEIKQTIHLIPELQEAEQPTTKKQRTLESPSAAAE